MHADYVPNPLYDSNPFIEALPPMLSGKDLIRALAVIPPYSDSDRDRSTGERLQLLSSLYEFYQPLSMTIDLYCEIYTAMQHCYGQYSIQSEAAAFQNGYALMHGNALAASIGGGNSFSVIGVSGLGKSTALQRVLSLFPQVIEHTSYHGQNFYCHQIPYLVVQTPHDASIKALILDIYLQIDSLVGTSYQKDALSRRLSIDVLVSQLNQIVRVNHIGLLVIDELQNIAYRKSDGGIVKICVSCCDFVRVDVVRQVLGNIAVEHNAQNVGFEIPAIHAPAQVVRNRPYCAVKFFAFLLFFIIRHRDSSKFQVHFLTLCIL